MKEIYRDITKQGPKGLRGLKGLKGVGVQGKGEESEFTKRLKKTSAKQLSDIYTPRVETPVGMQLAEAGYGNSIYDENILKQKKLENRCIKV